MEFALIRHTRCDIDPGVCYGHLDIPLASTAHADIEQTLARVPPVGAVYSSPSQRCHALAQALARRDGCDLRTRPDLRELNFGAWEGLPWNDVARTLSDEWAADPWNLAPPGGESERQLWERVSRVAKELLLVRTRTTDARRQSPRPFALLHPPHEVAGPAAVTRFARIAVVSHGGPLRHLRCLLTGAPAEARWSWHCKHGEVALIVPPESVSPSSDP
jgi:alpha-ribazole phosphatase